MLLRRLLCIWITISFLFTLVIPPQSVCAQTVLNLPKPGTLVSLSSAYAPVLIKGLKINRTNPLALDFIVATGNAVGARHAVPLQDKFIRDESEKLIKYFFAALTLPEKDVWVNLSPFEKDRIVPKATGETEMGRDMLAQDYLLKQMTASLIYPEKGLGKDFWNKVYTEANQRFGTTQVPVNTFNKVWIVADKASVYEAQDTVLVVDSHLKVMLEEDYLATQKHQTPTLQPTRGHVLQELRNVSPSRLPTNEALNVKAPQVNTLTPNRKVNELGSQIIKEIILPALEKEVNEGKNFANLRQIFHSLILAKWYKETLKTALLNQVYSNRNKVVGVGYKNSVIASEGKQSLNFKETNDVEAIYQQYLQAYKKGVFNYIKEDIDQASKRPLPRKYFSGGVTAEMSLGHATRSQAMISLRQIGELLRVGSLATKGPSPIEPAAPTIPGAIERRAIIDYLQKKAGYYDGSLNAGVGVTHGHQVEVVTFWKKSWRDGLIKSTQDLLDYQDTDSEIIRLSYIIRDKLGLKRLSTEYEIVFFNPNDQTALERIRNFLRQNREQLINATGPFASAAMNSPALENTFTYLGNGAIFQAVFIKGDTSPQPGEVTIINLENKTSNKIKDQLPHEALENEPQGRTIITKKEGDKLTQQAVYSGYRIADLKRNYVGITNKINGTGQARPQVNLAMSSADVYNWLAQAADVARARPELDSQFLRIRQEWLGGTLTNEQAVAQLKTLVEKDSLHQWNTKVSVEGAVDRAALANIAKPWQRGGIDLNASKLNMQKTGSGVDIKFDPATIEQFKMGDFNGIVPVITGITSITNIYSLLDLKINPRG